MRSLRFSGEIGGSSFVIAISKISVVVGQMIDLVSLHVPGHET